MFYPGLFYTAELVMLRLTLLSQINRDAHCVTPFAADGK